MMKTIPGISKIAAGCLALLVGAGASNAAVVSLNANDGVGTSSFNTANHWGNGQAPSAANDYNTAGFFMRSPGDGVTNYTFAGNSLTLGTLNLSGGVNGSFLEKFSGGAGTVRWLTINNITNLSNSMIRSGGTAGALIHIQANQYTIAGTSTFQADQCIWIIDAPLVGGDSIILTNFANNANDHVSFTATNSGFTGSLYLTGGGTSAWSLEMDSVYSLPGNPSSFNPGQFTFLGTGQLRDTVGCSFTNSNSGFTLAANGTINASATTLIGVPITDLTNGVHSLALLTSSGTGTLILSNANNNYSGGTTISAGTLQLGVDNAIPGNTVGGAVTANGILDLNGHNALINGLNGAGTVDTVSGGTPTLTIGANGDNGTFTGTIQNSSGTLSVIKVGAGTEIISGSCNISGTTTVTGGTLRLNSASTFVASTLVAGNGGVLSVDSSIGNPMVANNVLVGTNSILNLTLNSAANGINASGTLTLQDNATINLNYGSLSVNPSAPAINAAGTVSAPGTNIIIGITALGLKSGTFTLIKYAGATLPNLANFSLNLPLAVVATLVNNTGNHSIDINITTVPDSVAWNGVGGTNWDLTTVNWRDTVGGGFLAFRQGDSVTFDDTLTNDFVNPQPTNVNLTATFSVYPIPGLVVNSSLPYTFAGAGGITGSASIIKSNTGSLTILTSNSFTGGVSINDSGAVIITNDSALGASSGPLTLNGGTLQMNGAVTNSRTVAMPVAASIGVATNVTASFGGVISGAGATLNKIDNGTLILTAKETFTGNLFIHSGSVIIDTGGSITNGQFHDVGQNGNDSATLTMRGTGSFGTTSDFNVGDIDNSTGTFNLQGSATLVANAFFVGSANAAGSTASGTVNQTGGTLTEISTAVGSFSIGGRNSTLGVGVYNMSGGTLTANAGMRIGGTGIGTLNQSGGTINAIGGLNIARIGGSFGTNNLNGGTLVTFNVTSSTGSNAVFNFNGGTMQAAFNPPNPWMFGGVQANVLDGGAVIDSSTNNVTISTPLLAGSLGGGLTKKGSGTLVLTGTNTFTGPITNVAGTLFLNSASTYTGAAAVNGGTLQVSTASVLQGGATVTNGAVFAVTQIGSGTFSIGNLTLNGGATNAGATVGFTPATGNNPSVALMNCGTLTLNGTNTVNLAAVNVGTLALIHYTGALAGSGNITNLTLPQGATGTISNDVADSTLFAVITSTGPGLVWTGTNSAALNTWNINATTNWLVGAVPTSYHQIIIPGDSVTFNDSGNGTVILNTNVSPASMVISNTSKIYTFSGNGTISGATGLKKLGSNTAILNLTNNNYSGDTVVSNGTLQVGSTSAISPAANTVVGSGAILELAGFNQTVSELTGSGVVDNNAGVDLVLTVGTSSGGIWNGSIQDHGGGAVALTKNGTGTWVVGGSNRLANGSAFTIENIFNAGTTILTNGGSMTSPILQAWIANGAGSTATMIVDGGTLSVSNALVVGNSTNANGTLIVNNGTVLHGGGPTAAFSAANNIIVGGLGGTGTLTVNGGQVLNSQALALGQNPTGSGTLNLNGGLVQATALIANNTPAVSVANFNGGTLQAVTNSGDFLQVSSMVMSNGLVLDDGGWAISILTATLQQGDAFSGGLVKKGSGIVYMDSASSYIGTTVVTNGTLAGIGSVTGPLVVGPAGNIGAGDSAFLGTFTASSTLNLQGKATFRINRDSGPTSDTINAGGSITYGGTLVISNLSTTTLTTSDTFQLFSAPSHTGNFSNIAGSPGAGLAYSFNPVNGMLSIVTSTIATNPTNITTSVSGGSLTMSWPADHTGWTLQSNAVGLASSDQWFDYPASTGSRDTDTVTIPIAPAGPNVFFRLKYP